MRGSREISLAPSLHRASTDALIIIAVLLRTQRAYISAVQARTFRHSILCGIIPAARRMSLFPIDILGNGARDPHNAHTL